MLDGAKEKEFSVWDRFESMHWFLIYLCVNHFPTFLFRLPFFLSLSLFSYCLSLSHFTFSFFLSFSLSLFLSFSLSLFSYCISLSHFTFSFFLSFSLSFVLSFFVHSASLLLCLFPGHMTSRTLYWYRFEKKQASRAAEVAAEVTGTMFKSAMEFDKRNDVSGKLGRGLSNAIGWLGKKTELSSGEDRRGGGGPAL